MGKEFIALGDDRCLGLLQVGKIADVIIRIVVPDLRAPASHALVPRNPMYARLVVALKPGGMLPILFAGHQAHVTLARPHARRGSALMVEEHVIRHRWVR